MAGEEVDVSARFRLVDALAHGAGVVEAAKASGYSRKHVWHLRKESAFLAEVEERKKALTASAPASDSVDVEYAKKRLRELAEKPDEPGAYVAVNACKAILDLARKPIVKQATEALAPPPIKILPHSNGSDAADAWLKDQA